MIRRPWLWVVVALLYLLHNDLWLWDDARIVLGLPVGLAYHVGYCLAAALLMLAIVRRAWPRRPAPPGDGGRGERRP